MGHIPSHWHAIFAHSAHPMGIMGNISEKHRNNNTRTIVSMMEIIC